MRKSFSAFFNLNPSFVVLTEQRATSYWSCYHRNPHPSWTTYPAIAAQSRLKNVARIP